MAGVVLLVLVPPLPHYSPPTHLSPARTCDHQMSSIARRIIHQAWMPVVTQYLGGSLRLPLQCPIHPWRDQQGRAELAKLHYRVNLWTCAQCGKSFSGEGELEQHIAGRHPELSRPGDFSVCLADYCDILRCEGQKHASGRRPWPSRQPEGVTGQEVVRAPSRQLVALLEGTGHSGHSDHGQGEVCGSAQCSAGQAVRRPKRGLPHLYNASGECSDCSSGARTRCDPAAMRRLQERCEEVVAGCISPLALTLSDLELDQLRTGLEGKVCWFLTCERYWSQPEGRRKPNMLALALVVMALGAVFLSGSYYTVWVCF